MPQDSPQLLPGTLYMLILRILAAGPLHGYAISRRIKQCSADILDVAEGALSPAHHRMLLQGWLRARWGISEPKRRVRVDELTRDGRKQLTAETADFDKLIAAIQLVMKNA